MDQFTTTRSLHIAGRGQEPPEPPAPIDMDSTDHHDHERQQLAASHGVQVSNPPQIDQPPDNTK